MPNIGYDDRLGPVPTNDVQPLPPVDRESLDERLRSIEEGLYRTERALLALIRQLSALHPQPTESEGAHGAL